MSAPAASAGFRVTYDASLVEGSVLLAERRLPAAEAAAFRAERDRIYDVDDPDEREARFEELHGRFFLRLGLDRPLHEVLAERPEILLHARGCRVLLAVSRREEMADVRSEVGAPADAAPTLVIRLRPQSLLDPETLRTLLRRELLHVADMLDHAFGYLKELPSVETDPAVLNLLRERYRVLWDASIDGRLCRGGLLRTEARAARLAEFSRAFPMLRESAEAAFAPWFDGPRPTHAAMVAFIQEPLGPGTDDEARCPLCRLPTRALDRGPAALDRDVLRAIERDYPGWRPEHGRCARCSEVYAALLPTPGRSQGHDGRPVRPALHSQKPEASTTNTNLPRGRRSPQSPRGPNPDLSRHELVADFSPRCTPGTPAAARRSSRGLPSRAFGDP